MITRNTTRLNSEKRRDTRGRNFSRTIKRGRQCTYRRSHGDRVGITEWCPCTKLGELVKQGKIKSLEQIFLHSIPIKEHEIVEYILGPDLKKPKGNEIKTMQVKKQTCGGQQTRFKAFAVVGDLNGHVGLGIKSAKENGTAKEKAKNLALMNMIPVRRGYWGNKMGAPHSIQVKVTGKCGSVLVRLMPAPRGTGILAAQTSKDVLQKAGIKDAYTCSRGHTASFGNFMRATYEALSKTYGFLTPDLWCEAKLHESPYCDNSNGVIYRQMRYRT